MLPLVSPCTRLCHLVRSADLVRNMRTAMYAVAAGHVSGAKMELGEIGCLRVGLRGTRQVAMAVFFLQLSRFLGKNNVLEVHNWLNNANFEQLQLFFGEGQQELVGHCWPQ